MEEQGKPTIVFHPIISSIQKIALYETKSVSFLLYFSNFDSIIYVLVIILQISAIYLLPSFFLYCLPLYMYCTLQRFYLMGSNNTLTRFRVLKIDRMEPRELVVVDDKREYTQDEIKDLVNMIDLGNRTRVGQRNNIGGVARVVSAFGIVGKIRNIFSLSAHVDNYKIGNNCMSLYSIYGILRSMCVLHVTIYIVVIYLFKQSLYLCTILFYMTDKTQGLGFSALRCFFLHSWCNI